jgi:ribulose-phosphate 3-epimerase
MKAGVALNPHTPVSLLKNILPYIDMVLIMTVNPGYGGQSFIPDSYDKIAEMKNMIESAALDVLIQVDGGVGHDNAAQLVETGVDVLVAGNTVFASDNPLSTISWLKNLK